MIARHAVVTSRPKPFPKDTVNVIGLSESRICCVVPFTSSLMKMLKVTMAHSATSALMTAQVRKSPFFSTFLLVAGDAAIPRKARALARAPKTPIAVYQLGVLLPSNNLKLKSSLPGVMLSQKSASGTTLRALVILCTTREMNAMIQSNLDIL